MNIEIDNYNQFNYLEEKKYQLFSNSKKKEVQFY